MYVLVFALNNTAVQCTAAHLQCKYLFASSTYSQYDGPDLNKCQKARPKQPQHQKSYHWGPELLYVKILQTRAFHSIYCFSTAHMGTLTCCSSKISVYENARVCRISNYGDSRPLWYDL